MGLKEGRWLYFWSDGTLLGTGECRDDRHVGNWREYYRGGQPRLLTCHLNNGWKWETAIWSNGAIWTYGLLSPTARLGIWIENYPDGRLHFLDSYDSKGTRVLRLEFSLEGKVRVE